MRWWVGILMADDDRKPIRSKLGWRGIRWFQGYKHYKLGAAVHCFLVFEINGAFQVYETSDLGYRTSSLAQRTSGTPVDIFEMPGDGRKAYDHAVNLLKEKTRYGFADIAAFGPILLAERFLNLPNQLVGKPYRPMEPVKNWWNMSDAVYCTESTLDAMDKAGLKSPWSKIHSGVRCTHLWDFFMDNQEFSLVKSTIGGKITIL